MTRHLRGPGLAYAAVCLALWPLPVFGVLHAEASAVVAGASFFIAGLAAVPAFRRGETVGGVLGRQLACLLVPGVLLTATLLWRPNCAYATGLGLFLTLVPPSTVLAVALAYALTGTRWRGPRASVVAVGLAVAVGGVVADLGVHPQLFTYNHVFGGVLGPIYDEELAIRPGLFAFRALTLLWAVALVLVGSALRAEGAVRRRLVRLAAVAVVAIGGAYVFSVPLGFQQSHAALARALGAASHVGPFRIYYDASEVSAVRLARIEDELAYRHRQLEARLGIAPSQPIRVYLYPDPETKGRLIGSRTTSVVPVWLPAPQIHMLADEVERSAAHELVHVFAREFGMPGLRASPAVGLVEGLAVALEPPDGLPAPADLVLAAQASDLDAGGLATDPADVAAATLSPLGFWTARAGVAYTTSGAFVAWLLDTYGPEPFRRAYRSGDVEGAYGRPVRQLADAWARSLDGQTASPQAVELAASLLTRRSLFERACPHHVPAFVRDAREGGEALEAGRFRDARAAYRKAVDAEPAFEAAVVGWAAASIATGDALGGAAARRLEALALDSLAGPEVARALADLARVEGRDRDADRLYAEALSRTPTYAPLWQGLTRLRATLSPDALRVLARAPADPARAAALLDARAPVHAALLWEDADAPREAWSRAQRWDLDRLAATPVERAALLGLQGRIAYRAGDLAAARVLAARAARRFRQLGRPAAAERAVDWRARSAWRALSSATSPE